MSFSFTMSSLYILQEPLPSFPALLPCSLAATGARHKVGVAIRYLRPRQARPQAPGKANRAAAEYSAQLIRPPTLGKKLFIRCREAVTSCQLWSFPGRRESLVRSEVAQCPAGCVSQGGSG